MTKWEYKTLIIYNAFWNPHVSDESGIAPFEEGFAQLGQEGWELCWGFQSENRVVTIFKRALPN